MKRANENANAIVVIALASVASVATALLAAACLRPLNPFGQPCAAVADCPAGSACFEGACVDESFGLLARPDAGFDDGGVPIDPDDGGFDDGGVPIDPDDGGFDDGGTPIDPDDAGPPDAGPAPPRCGDDVLDNGEACDYGARTGQPGVACASDCGRLDFATPRRISVPADGTAPDGDSTEPAISADGRFVAFVSVARNLTTPLLQNQVGIIHIHDLRTGKTQRIVGASGGNVDGFSTSPAISGDGGRVVFTSSASNLVFPDGNQVRDVYFFDRIGRSLRILSRAAGGGDANAESNAASISADGSTAAFTSGATNLTTPGGGNVEPQVFTRDLDSADAFTVRRSTDSSGVVGNNVSGNPALSSNGTVLVFESAATNLVEDPDENLSLDIFRVVQGTTTRISQDTAGQEGNSQSIGAAISGDGTVIAFSTLASVLTQTSVEQVVAARNGNVDVVSRGVDGERANAAAHSADVSSDGRFVVFVSAATNLGPTPPAGFTHIFLRDLVDPPSAPARLVAGGTGDSASPSMASGPGLVAFQSAALLANGENDSRVDVYVVRMPAP